MARLFALVPVILEVASILIAGQIIGPLATFGAILVGAFIGGFILTRLGRAFFADLQQTLNSGERPEGAMLRAICLLGAGVLFITPGFLSDLVAILLLIPGSRALLAPVVWQRVSRPGRGPRQPRWTGKTRPAGPAQILDGEYKDVTESADKDGGAVDPTLPDPQEQDPAPKRPEQEGPAPERRGE